MEQNINGPHFSSWEDAVQWLRNQPDRQDLVRAAYYDDPLSEAVERYYRSEEWAEISAMLPASRGWSLDVGAGRGIASYALAREGFKVTALEPDESKLVGANAIRAMAEESGVDIEVIEDFSEKLPFEDHQFDVVFARAVLHHTRDLEAACAEFFRVLKPGGKFIAVREHVISRDEDLDAFLEIHPLHKLYGGENAFRLAQYESAITKSGFHLERISSPLESAVNYFPHTLRGLQREIAIKASRNLPVVRTILEHLLRIPFMWSLALPLLTRLDKRPGRLYSFVAIRPA